MGEEIEKIFDKKTNPEKKKRALTQKQIDALARGRAKVEEKRRQKKLNKDVEKEIAEKKEEQKKTRQKTIEEQAILEKIRIRQKAQRERDEAEAKRQASIKKWENIRLKALEKCQTEEQYEKVSEYLDKFEDEDITDYDKIMKKYNSLFKHN